MAISQSDVLPLPRAIYRMAMLLAVVALLVSVPLEMAADRPFAFNLVFLPVAALLLALQGLWPSRDDRVGYRQVTAGYLSVVGVFLVEFGATLHGYVDSRFYAGELSEVTVWAPVLVLAAYVIFRPRLATALVAVQMGLVVAASSVYVVWDMRVGSIDLPLNTLSDLVLACATVLLLLHVFRHMSENFITVQATAENQTRLANTDHLTGLPNRRALYDALDAALQNASSRNLPLSVILFDLDHFKAINDGHGHLVGDRVLNAVATFAGGRLRRRQTLGRWGGEEFLIVMEGTALEPSASFARVLNSELATADLLPGVRVTASFGVAEFQEGDSIGALLQRADMALYRAKQDGRARVSTTQNTSTPAPLATSPTS